MISIKEEMLVLEKNRRSEVILGLKFQTAYTLLAFRRMLDLAADDVAKELVGLLDCGWKRRGFGARSTLVDVVIPMSWVTELCVENLIASFVH